MFSVLCLLSPVMFSELVVFLLYWSSLENAETTVGIEFNFVCSLLFVSNVESVLLVLALDTRFFSLDLD